MSLWVQRTSTGGGTLVHYSVQTNGQGWCTVPIGFSSAGNIIATAWAPNNQVTGPVLSINTWTHIATTYSRTRGLTLYVNGTSVGNTAPQPNDAPGTPVILTLGNSQGGGGCNSQSIVPGTFYGYLDEFRVYSRELSATEVYALTKDKTCSDGIMNGDESDIDCGGSCLACAADTNNHRIQKWLPGASSGTTAAGVTGSSGSNLHQLNNPQSVVVDSVGNIYISDGNNYRVLQWPLGASYGIVVAGHGVTGTSLHNIGYAADAKVDPSGNIYVPDWYNGRVLKWTPPSSSGTLVAGQISNSGSNADQLNQPSHVIFDSVGNIYVCDAANNRIQRWVNGSSTGSTIVGTGTAGLGSNQLNHPYGITFDLFNNLYVADCHNNRIQRFNLTHA
ncbi:unnamed protein product [Adineta steineri]|uniref:LamG-like jellyroll fold domain-containing protein n=1 Tax=Adineta steineri TaxID=433720 RepID=A0A819QJY9_9BILA|nr:unnamed protein product [Adineta steineri]CAF4026636.1 unnamed protein product [Adineta steineri]